MKYFLGIDNGGTSIKAIIFNETGKEISRASAAVSSITFENGFVEQDMDLLWTKNCQVIRQALESFHESPSCIQGISFSGHGKGLYLINSEGLPARNGILSSDSRAYSHSQNLRQHGFEVLPCQPICILKWLQEWEPEVLSNVKWVFGVKDYIRYKMTGIPFAEITDFSGSGFVNIETGKYDTEIIEKAGLEEVSDKLPPLIHSSEFAGRLSKKASLETGLAEGTPCAAGLFDIDACAAGMGLLDESKAAVIAGTWGITEYLSAVPDNSLPAYQNSISFLPGKFMIEKSSPTSASNFEWILRNLLQNKLENPKGNIYDFATALAESVPVQKQHIMYFPFLYGGSQSWDTKAAFLGISAVDSINELVRAVMEGIVYYHRYQLESLYKNKELPAKILISGGVVNSDFWTQMFADIYQIPLEICSCKETGTLGAAMSASIAAGVYPDFYAASHRMTSLSKTIYPDKENGKYYSEKYFCYKELLTTIWKERL